MNERIGLSSFSMKIIASVTMLIDHIGYALFPSAIWLRCIGRIAFPIYCFLLTEGFAHTRSFTKYLTRLVIFAFISEIPFSLIVSGKILDFSHQNVFFTLALGLAAIKCYDLLGGVKKLWFSLPAIAAFAAVAWLIKTDYAWYGVIMIAVFHCFRKNRLWQAAAFALLVCLRFLVPADINLFSLFAIIPICLYNGLPGRRVWRYAFYVFYPVHILILALTAIFLGA